MGAKSFCKICGQMALISVLVFSSVAMAQDSTAPEASPTSAAAAGAKKSDKKQTLNFEDELVEGSTQKPELFYLFQKKNFNYKRLIRLRENFLPEMRKTSEDIQRVRGAN